MLHLREHGPRSWPRRASPAGKRDASATSSGAKKSPGWSCAVRTVSCFPSPGSGQTFPSLLCRPLTRLSTCPRSFWLLRPWWNSCGLCGIVQESRDLPGQERKEGKMICTLAQIILRQMDAPSGRRLHEVDAPPLLDATTKEAASVSGTRSQVPVPLPDKVEPDASMWPEPLAQSLVRRIHRVSAAPRAGRADEGGEQ